MAVRPFSPGHRIPADLLLRAYASGVFPMAEDADDPEVFWVRPESRGIIPLDSFHIPRTLRKLYRQGRFEIRHDTSFEKVIEHCAQPSPGRDKTWINAPIREAYGELFARGHVHTVEAWREGELVGGLYGVSLGRAFFGESMFSRESGASQVCLVDLVRHLTERGYQLLDTQFTTDHLLRFGAIDVARRQYEVLLAAALHGEPATF